MMKRPRHPIVLLHGLYGTDFRGPDRIPWLQVKYWKAVLGALEDKVGCKVHSIRVPGTASIEERARVLHHALEERFAGQKVNLLAHSMGGLDARAVLTPDGGFRDKRTYQPVSLTTLSTPHRGSPFMDWCQDVLGLGVIGMGNAASAELTLLAQAASSTGKGKPLLNQDNPLTKTILKMVDSPAYSNLTTAFCRDEFNPRTRDDEDVAYFSYGASHVVSIVHPLYFPQMVVTAAEGPENDGLVSTSSAKWGTYLGTMPCDHWDLRGQRSMAVNMGLDKINLAALAMGWSSAGRMVEALNRSVVDIVKKVPFGSIFKGQHEKPEFGLGDDEPHPYADEDIRAEIISLSRLAQARALLDERGRAAEDEGASATRPAGASTPTLTPPPWKLEEAYALMAARLYDAGF